jgi:quinol monooxygenase YgiN
VILITGSVLARPETFEEIRTLCLAHVRRSRGEDGCLHHAVHADVDNPLRLVFVEKWRDRQAVAAHFADKNARAFVQSVRALAAEPTRMEIYDTESIPLEQLV